MRAFPFTVRFAVLAFSVTILTGIELITLISLDCPLYRFLFLFVWVFILSTMMPRMKRTSLNPGSVYELNALPDHPSGLGSSPRRSVEGIESSRIRELPWRMSL